MVDNINNVNSLGGANPSRRLHKAYTNPQKPAEKSDSVQMSSEIKDLSQMEGIRLEKVMAVKKALAEGTYITDEKLDIALDKGIDEAYGIKREEE
ncbi:MAG: flagellar biosynthesis anti-sigma factor FlgM [Planctomycetota bacterium]|jgi:anti-sigma28 factor (negative regulator of flagellin synthesis)